MQPTLKLKALPLNDPWNDPLVGTYIRTQTDDQLYIILSRRADDELIEVEVEAVATPGKSLLIQILAKTKEIHGVFQVN